MISNNNPATPYYRIKTSKSYFLIKGVQAPLPTVFLTYMPATGPKSLMYICRSF